MPTDSISDLTQYIVDLLKANQIALGLEDVWYGDQQKIPRTPAAAVESGLFTRDLAGAMERTENTFTVTVFLYIAAVKDIQIVRKDSDALAEQVMYVLHSDLRMGGRVIHGFVTSIEPGFAIRAGQLMRAARLTWQGKSKTSIKV